MHNTKHCWKDMNQPQSMRDILRDRKHKIEFGKFPQMI